MEIKQGGTVIIKGDNIESGGLKIVYASGQPKPKAEPVTVEELHRKIDFVRPHLTCKRLWFPVCKYMMWHKMVADGDFKSATSMLMELYPGLLLNAKDMESLNVLSFRKPLEEWNPGNAPVTGQTFAKYLGIAEMMDAV